MKHQELDWEERLWQLSTHIYDKLQETRPEVDIRTLSEAAIAEATSFLNTYIRKQEEQGNVNFHSEII